jgi:uncharacterized protein
VMGEQSMSGYMHSVPHDGRGVPIDELFQRGVAFAAGRAGEVDLVEAHKCFNLAAAAGDAGAARRREEIAAEMSRDEIAEALRAAREWLAHH